MEVEQRGRGGGVADPEGLDGWAGEGDALWGDVVGGGPCQVVLLGRAADESGGLSAVVEVVSERGLVVLHLLGG